MTVGLVPLARADSSGRIGRDPDQELAEVLALEQADERRGRVLEALADVLAIAQPPVAHPLADVGQKIARREIEHDEAADGEASGQDLAQQERRAIGPGRQPGRVVPGDGAADRHPGEVVEQRKDRLEHPPADVLPVDVDAARAGGAQPLREIGRMVIEAGVEAELAGDEVALRLGTGDAHHPTAPDPGDLADHRADRPGGRGHHQGLAGLGPADLAQPDVRGLAGHAEDALRGRDRRQTRIDLLCLAGSKQGVVLPAAAAGHDLARGEAGEIGAHHLTDRAAGHDLAERHRLRIGRPLVHPPAHVRVEREIDRPDEHLAGAGLGNRRLLEPEILRPRAALLAARRARSGD